MKFPSAQFRADQSGDFPVDEEQAGTGEESPQEIQNLLRPWMNVFYDEAGAIGKAATRHQDPGSPGTPFCVTIDFDTLGEKPELLDTVTLRERDTMQQTRVKIADLVGLLLCEKIR